MGHLHLFRHPRDHFFYLVSTALFLHISTSLQSCAKGMTFSCSGHAPQISSQSSFFNSPRSEETFVYNCASPPSIEETKAESRRVGESVGTGGGKRQKRRKEVVQGSQSEWLVGFKTYRQQQDQETVLHTALRSLMKDFSQSDTPKKPTSMLPGCQHDEREPTRYVTGAFEGCTKLIEGQGTEVEEEASAFANVYAREKKTGKDQTNCAEQKKAAIGNRLVYRIIPRAINPATQLPTDFVVLSLEELRGCEDGTEVTKAVSESVCSVVRQPFLPSQTLCPLHLPTVNVSRPFNTSEWITKGELVKALRAHSEIKYVARHRELLLSTPSGMKGSRDLLWSHLRTRSSFNRGRVKRESESSKRQKNVTALNHYQTSDWEGIDSSNTSDSWSSLFPSLQRRRRLESISGSTALKELWEMGFTGKGVKVAVFDTGLGDAKDICFKNVKERSNWTNEKQNVDIHGHGTFVAGVIGSTCECSGIAPDAELYIFRIFTNKQTAYTSWFLDAFNYVLFKEIEVLNISIGGPNYLDFPFLDKIRELAANRVLIVSAIGNEGPDYGTHMNPADMAEVIGVGGLNVDRRVAHFSARGMTTWELPGGYGRIKPDLVTQAESVAGLTLSGGCKLARGTSVASPIVAGVASLLMSILPSAIRRETINPASIKQILTESAVPLHDHHIFEQGFGALDLSRASAQMRKYRPKVTISPPALHLEQCPYMWPYCTQPLYYDGNPVTVNATVLNGISLRGRIVGTPQWIPLEDQWSSRVEVSASFSERLWPWVGWIAVDVSVRSPVSEPGLAQGALHLTVESYIVGDENPTTVISHLTLPVSVQVIPTPPRKRRLLWDQAHSIHYPKGVVPSDHIETFPSDNFDRNADHLHTNFHTLWTRLRAEGYFMEVLSTDLTALRAQSFGALLLVDPEGSFTQREGAALREAVLKRGLSLFVASDWYNPDLVDSLAFFDINHLKQVTPITGGSNVPALNNLLSFLGIEFGFNVYSSRSDLVRVGNHNFSYITGTHISKFPEGGRLWKANLHVQTMKASFPKKENVAVFGLLQPTSTEDVKTGRVAVFGDSSCLDSSGLKGRKLTNEPAKDCLSFVVDVLRYLTDDNMSPEWQNQATKTEAYHYNSQDAQSEMTSSLMSPKRATAAVAA